MTISESDQELDLQLLQLAQSQHGKKAGDRAFTAIVERYQGPLLLQIQSSIRDRDRALEILQDCFLRAYQALPKARPDTRVRAWLGRIAQNLCIDEIRRQQGARGSTRSLDESGVHRRGRLRDEVPSQEPDPASHALNAERKRELQEAVKQLPAISREIIQLRVFENLSYKDIAAILGCREGSAKQRMYKATVELRKILKKTR